MSNLTEISEKIAARAQAADQWKTATLNTRQVVAESYTPEDFDRLAAMLKQRPLNGDAVFRLHAFIYEQQEARVPDAAKAKAADNLHDCFEKADSNWIGDAVLIFALWGKHRPDYYDKCSSLLNHSSESARLRALQCVPVFLKQRDYAKLLKFRNDPAFTEIGMGGPLRFHLRDQALEILEKLTSAQPAQSDCFESTEAGSISYRSWTPFLNWWEKHSGKFTN